MSAHPCVAIWLLVYYQEWGVSPAVEHTHVLIPEARLHLA